MISRLNKNIFSKIAPTNFLKQQICLSNLSKYFSTEPSVILNKYTQHISQILLNQPKTRNAVSHQIVKQLNQILKELAKDTKLRALIIRSSHPGIFCAGANLKERLAMKSDSQVISFLERMRVVGQALFAIEVPTIAAIDGTALGGGLQLALTCDLRVSTSRALLGLPQTGLAIIPGLFGTQLLSYSVGQAKAKEMIFTGKLLNGIQAKELGLVNEVIVVGEGGTNRVDIDGDQYSRQMIQWARDTAQKISQNAPVGEKMSKRAINQGFLKNFSKGADIQWDCYNMLLKTQDRLEGLRAFSEKRKPVYQGK